MISRMFLIILVILIAWAIFMYFFWGNPKHYYNYVIKPGTVALTFDDGPTIPYTSEILSILKKNKVHATFFVLGVNAKKHPEIIREAYKEGNAIACHGVNSINLTKATKDQLISEVRGCKKIVRDIIGKNPICFRPAYNKFNENVQKYIESQNMTMVKVDLDSSDWRAPGVNAIVENTLKMVRPQGILTFHDGTIENEDRSQTVAALPIVIKKLREMGLGFSRICYP